MPNPKYIPESIPNKKLGNMFKNFDILAFSLTHQFLVYLHVLDPNLGDESHERADIYLDYDQQMLVVRLPKNTNDNLKHNFRYARHISNNPSLTGYYRVVRFCDVTFYCLDNNIASFYFCKSLKPLKVTSPNKGLINVLEKTPPIHFLPLNPTAFLPLPYRNITTIATILGIKLPSFLINYRPEHQDDRAGATRLASMRYHNEYDKWLGFMRKTLKLTMKVDDDEVIRRYTDYVINANRAIRRDNYEPSRLGRALKNVASFFKF